VTSWYYANLVLIQATVVSILTALSIQVPIRMGVFSFAGIGSYAIGAYFAAISVIRFQMPTVVAVLGGIVISIVVSYLLSLVLARLQGLYLGMATIAFVLIIAVVIVNGGELTGGPNGLFGAVSQLQTWMVITMTVVVLALVAYSERGRLGRRVDAVREDPELALSVGIPVIRMRQAAFVVSGILGSLGGACSVLLRQTVTPEDVSFHLVVLLLTIIIVGGSRSWVGVVIGAVIFTWLPTVLTFLQDWKTVAYGILVTLAAVWVPDGVWGLITQAYGAIRRRGVGPADVVVAGSAPEGGLDGTAEGVLAEDTRAAQLARLGADGDGGAR
jgi:branched-chain amino acid transport system permease protein